MKIGDKVRLKSGRGHYEGEVVLTYITNEYDPKDESLYHLVRTEQGVMGFAVQDLELI